MANAKQCDRCKTFYMREYLSKNEYKITHATGMIYDLDLCPKCYSDLLKFLGIESEKPKKEKKKKDGTN